MLHTNTSLEVKTMALTDTFVKQVKPQGKSSGEKYADGGGMYLHVTQTAK